MALFKKLMKNKFTTVIKLNDGQRATLTLIDEMHGVKDFGSTKKKFNIADYPGKYAMHCENSEELFRFYDYLHSVGRKWSNGSSYAKTRFATNYVRFNEGSHCFIKPSDVTVLEFKDFDWSDIDMNFEIERFTKADLKNTMVVELRNGDRYFVMGRRFLNKFGYFDYENINNDLTYAENKARMFDIVKVYSVVEGATDLLELLDTKCLKLIWERKDEAKEMTVAEIEKQLGYKVKIVDGE